MNRTDKWIGMLIDAAKRDLADEPLSAAELRLLERVDALELALPGAVSDALMAYAFAAASTGLKNEEDLEEQIAAATARTGEPISTWVRTALNQGESVVRVPLAGEDQIVLNIDILNRQVSPCIVQGWTFTIENGDREMEAVSEFGGHFRRFDDLDGLYLHIDELRRILSIESRLPEPAHAQTC